jgi:iron complex transport system substrate-binding protein
LAGTEKIANQAAALFWQHYRQIQQQYSGKPVVSVFYVLWPQPLLTINQQSLISQILTLCGGKTIFTALYGTTPVVNIEAVLAADPAVMLGDKASHWQEMWYKWPQLRAVKNDHLFSVNPDWIDRAGPRLLRGADQICEYLELVRRNSSINLDNHATR